MPPTERPATLVVGAGGLLGGAVVRQLQAGDNAFTVCTVPWHDPEGAVCALDVAGAALLAEGGPWRLLWCAGAGVIGTPDRALREELDVLEGFLLRFGDRLRGSTHGPGGLFLASSAGGLYAGSTGLPFGEDTTPAPISSYGETKLAAERLVARFGRRTGVPTLVGRIANLYGPGQDISKPQGLVTQLCLNHLTRKPSSIYVSLDTARDYIFVDDCARMTLRAMELASRSAGPSLKVIASEQALTVGAILGELKHVTHRRPQVVLGASPLARFQTRDLRFRSSVWPELRAEARTPLGAGLRITLDSLSRVLQSGRLAPSTPLPASSGRA